MKLKYIHCETLHCLTLKNKTLEFLPEQKAVMVAEKCNEYANSKDQSNLFSISL